MGLSIITYLLVLFEVFMLSAEGVTTEAKRVSLGITIVVALYLIYNVVWG